MESSAPRPLAEEVTVLRAELTEVKKQLADLHRFLSIETREDGSKYLGVVTCSVLNVCNPEKEQDTRIFISGAEDEAAIALWGDDHRARLLLRVNEERRGSAVIYGREENVAVELWADPGDHGQILVRSAEGKPRAGMKSLPGAGVVSAVADDGSVRAVLRSGENTGEVAVAMPGKVCAQLHAGEQGGLITCFGLDASQPGAVLTTKEGGDGVVLVSRRDGRIGATIACADTSTIFSLHGGSGGFEDGDANTVHLTAHSAGNSLSLHNDSGQEVLRMITTTTGASLSLHQPTGEPIVALHSSDGAGLVSVQNPAHQGMAIIGNNSQGGYLTTRATDGARSTILQFVEGGANLTFFRDLAAGTPTLTLGYDADHQSIVQLFGPTGSEAPFVTLFTHEHGGSILAHGSDGTRQAGLSASEHGGSVAVFSELGVERATLHSAEDGGTLGLKWGGTNALFACGTERGGLLTALDPTGKIRSTFPSAEEFEDPDGQDSQD